MKLLFYIHTMQGGGAERVMSVICNELAERGHDVRLAVDTSYPIVYPLNGNVDVIDISLNGKQKKLTDNIPARIKRIRRVAKEVRPDVVVSFMIPMTVLVVLALAGLKIPVIASEHTNFQKTRMSTWKKALRLFMLRFADRVAILTQSDFDYLGRKLPGKIVMPNPLSYPIYEKEIMPRKKNILAAGSVSRWYIKGFDDLIGIWSEIAPLYPEWTLDIAGGGKEADFDYLRNIAATNGIEDRVNFMGFVGNIDDVMRQSSIFALSSRHEGFPMALVEATSQGCACVSYDCKTGPCEMIVNEKSGLLVPDRNKEEFKQALIRLIENEELRKKLSQAGRREVKRFAPDIIADRWEELFKEVVLS